jgi:integrase
LFPSPVGGGELTSTTLLKVGKRHSNGVPVTTHGWRSTFRDWVGDETDAEWDVGEAALSHKIKDKTQAAYRRQTALKKRRALFQGWYEYLNSGA